jgi:predicted transcriptional regulator
MPYAEVFEKTEIELLRIKKMRKLAPRMILIKKEKGKSYFYDPVLSVDSELNVMNKFIDKFLAKAFKVSPGVAS